LTIRTTILDCGITVVSEAMPEVRSVTAGFWVGTGSRDEPANLAGASHFLEHLLFKGTPSRSARSIAEAVDAVGGDMNAFTTKEYTSFYVRVLDEHMGLAFDILSDIFWDPAFRPNELDAERRVILEEILMREDEPADLVHEVFAEAIFPGHPLGREVLGDKSTVSAIARDDIAGFFAEHYRPVNIVFAAAGRLEHAEVVDGVQARFAGPSGGRRPKRSAPDGAPVPVALHSRKTEQAHLVYGMMALDRHDEDRFALAVLNHILGGGLSSRLFQTIREERGLAYSVYSYRSSFDDTGSLSIYAGTTPARAEEVLGLICAEVEAVLEDGVSRRELEVAAGHLRGDLALSLEDSAGRMSRIGRSQLVHGEVLSVDEVVARIEAVTVDDVAAVAKRVLGNPPVLAVVGPFDDTGRFEPFVASSARSAGS